MKCNSCGAVIAWARTVTGKASPMELHADGAWIIDDDGVMRPATFIAAKRYRSHFASCPQAPQWRRKETR